MIDAMTFATLISLICNWKQERAAEASDKFADFMLWLTNHNFHHLNSEILSSRSLNDSLHDLLRSDITALGDALELVATGVSAIAEKIDSLAELTNAAGVNSGALSDQALRILVTFYQSEADTMGYYKTQEGPLLILTPNNARFMVEEHRFVENDLQALDALGLISLSSYARTGEPFYSLTRYGARFAASVDRSTQTDAAR